MKGYTVTADYARTVSRINLNKVRYVAIFEGTALDPMAPATRSTATPPPLSRLSRLTGASCPT